MLIGVPCNIVTKVSINVGFSVRMLRILPSKVTRLSSRRRIDGLTTTAGAEVGMEV